MKRSVISFLKEMVLEGNLALIHKLFLKLLCKREAQQQLKSSSGYLVWKEGEEMNGEET